LEKGGKSLQFPREIRGFQKKIALVTLPLGIEQGAGLGCPDFLAMLVSMIMA
jgi:hypothetical protein